MHYNPTRFAPLGYRGGFGNWVQPDKDQPLATHPQPTHSLPPILEQLNKHA